MKGVMRRGCIGRRFKESPYLAGLDVRIWMLLLGYHVGSKCMYYMTTNNRAKCMKLHTCLYITSQGRFLERPFSAAMRRSYYTSRL
jgi:hypothetical protein